MSNEAEILALDHVWRSETWAKVPNLYAALYLTDPTDAGTGTEVSADGTGYARVAVPVADASWTAPVDMGGPWGVTNLLDIQYADPIAPWGTPAYWGLHTAVTGGDLWLYGPIQGTLRTVEADDDPVSLAPGAITVMASGAMSAYLKAGILNHMLRTAELVKPANVYAGLHSDDPGDDSFDFEFVGTNYARVAIAVADAQWSNPFTSGTDMRITNVNSIQFPAPLSEWGTYTHTSLSDALTAGNQLISASMVTPRTVNSNDNPPVWLPGAYQIQIG